MSVSLNEHVKNFETVAGMLVKHVAELQGGKKIAGVRVRKLSQEFIVELRKLKKMSLDHQKSMPTKKRVKKEEPKKEEPKKDDALQKKKRGRPKRVKDASDDKEKEKEN